MNPLPDEVWSCALPYPEYRESVRRNGEVFDQVYQEPAYAPEEVDRLRRLPPLRVLALAEDWCPDVYHTLATWARLAEELPGWELRVLPRDANPEVMDHFVWWNGSRRIPVYAFYDGEGRLQTWWSGRSAPAQQAVDGFLAGRAFADLDEAAKAEAGRLLDDGYRQRFRHDNFEEVLTQLLAFFHR